MTAYYVALLLIVAASIPAAAWLKREADQAWAAERRPGRVVLRIAPQFTLFAAAMADLGGAATRAAADMEKAQESIRRAMEADR